MAERLPTEKARQRGWQALCGRCGSPDSCMWCLANVEQTRNIRVRILARIRPEEGEKLGEPGREEGSRPGDSGRVVRGDGEEASACFAAAALPLDRPPGVCLWSPTNTISAGCWMAASAAIS